MFLPWSEKVTQQESGDQQLMEDYDAPGLLVATTNIESSLDSALFRRFDDVFMVPPPE